MEAGGMMKWRRECPPIMCLLAFSVVRHCPANRRIWAAFMTLMVAYVRSNSSQAALYLGTDLGTEQEGDGWLASLRLAR